MSNELLPCPFCGSSMVRAANERGLGYAECEQCGCFGPTGENNSWRDGNKKWNTRAELAAHKDEPLSNSVVTENRTTVDTPSPAAVVSNEPSAAQNGYVLAPIEPTEAMLRQVESNWSGFADTDAKPAARRLYKAMLQAAPRTPVSNDGKTSVSVGWGEVEFLIDQVHGMQCYCSGERIHIPGSWHGTKFSMQCRRCKTLDALREIESRARELAKAGKVG